MSSIRDGCYANPLHTNISDALRAPRYEPQKNIVLVVSFSMFQTFAEFSEDINSEVMRTLHKVKCLRGKCLR